MLGCLFSFAQKNLLGINSIVLQERSSGCYEFPRIGDGVVRRGARQLRALAGDTDSGDAQPLGILAVFSLFRDIISRYFIYTGVFSVDFVSRDLTTSYPRAMAKAPPQDNCFTRFPYSASKGAGDPLASNHQDRVHLVYSTPRSIAFRWNRLKLRSLFRHRLL